MNARSLSLIACLLLSAAVVATTVSAADLLPNLEAYVGERSREFDQIPAARRDQLKPLVEYIRTRQQQKQPIQLTFVCTHNSRRSHLSQVWAAISAVHYQVTGVQTFSGGTEATAFNPRAIAALGRAGVRVEALTESKNPRYAVRFSSMVEPLICFSKVHNQPPNPTADFCAILVCTEADKSCPVIAGAEARIMLPFDDPKIADGTAEESAKYDERCAQIAREMLFVFSQVNGQP